MTAKPETLAQAWSACQSGNLAEAARLYRQALQADAANPDAWCMLGIVSRALGQLDQAVTAYREALRLRPDFVQVHNNLGNVLVSQGQLDEAIDSFQHALRLDKDLPAARANLEQALRQKADRDRAAVKPVAAAVQQPPERPGPVRVPVRPSTLEDWPTFYLLLPWGSTFGWGVCGKYIARELSRLATVRCLTQGLDRSEATSELEYRFFEDKLANPQETEFLERANDLYPIVQAIQDNRMTPFLKRVTAPYKVGYTFFENLVAEADVRAAGSYFDLITAGSTWCASMLREKGHPQATVVLQGIDPLTFNPLFAEKEMFRDRFVVFSGGKFEYRKGQDLVIRAFKVLQDKYADVLLINSWVNSWVVGLQLMAKSPHIHFEHRTGDFVSNMNRTLLENGIDLDRVVTLPSYPHEVLARIYQNTDIGLFPNRCEGGTNLVMMEYMACGKPVIASYSSGHKDIVNRDNAILIETLRPLTLYREHQPYAVWDDPDLEETIHHLEWAYHHREELRTLGRRAGEHLANFTWKKTAEHFYRLLCQAGS